MNLGEPLITREGSRAMLGWGAHGLTIVGWLRGIERLSLTGVKGMVSLLAKCPEQPSDVL